MFGFVFLRFKEKAAIVIQGTLRLRESSGHESGDIGEGLLCRVCEPPRDGYCEERIHLFDFLFSSLVVMSPRYGREFRSRHGQRS
jgi:hypothetical protein